MQLEQDVSVAVASTRAVARFGGDAEQTLIRSTSWFGAWRARMILLAALALGRRSMRGLSDSNPVKVLVQSTIDRFDERTRDLPKRGVMPINPDAPLVSLCEALWLIVLALVGLYVTLRLTGHHPIRTETGEPLSFWLTFGHRL